MCIARFDMDVRSHAAMSFFYDNAYYIVMRMSHGTFLKDKKFSRKTFLVDFYCFRECFQPAFYRLNL